MTILVDTAPLVSLADLADPRRLQVRATLRSTRERLVVPAPITAEVDYFLSSRFPAVAARNFLVDIATGRFEVECLDTSEYLEILRLEQRYAAFRPGLADLSIVVIAARFKTRKLLTFDERHFRNMEPLQGGRFTILPADDDNTGA